MRNYKNQFDNYPIENEAKKLISIGFQDTSWGNDVCPSFENEKLKIRVWVDHSDSELREISGYHQYAIAKLNNDLEPIETLLETDDFQEIIDFIKSMRNYDILETVFPTNFEESKRALELINSLGLLWHFEDSPKDIIWNCKVRPTDQDISELARIQKAIWEVCNPWEIISKLDCIDN